MSSGRGCERVKVLLRWLQAARAHFLGVSLFPYATAVAVAAGVVREVPWRRVWLGAVGLALIHLGANLWNDYWDERLGADRGLRTTWSGGSGVTRRGLLTAGQVLRGALLLVAAGSAVGIYLDVVSRGHVIFWLGLVGVALALGYSAPPVKLAWRGWGESAVGLAFGPVVMCGAHWVVAGRWASGLGWSAVAAGLMTALVLLVNEFPDREADRRAGKRTLVVRLSPAGAARLAWVLWAAAYGSVAMGVWTEALPVEALLVLVTVPIAVAAAVMLEEGRLGGRPKALETASALQVLLQGLFLVGLGWAVLTG